MALKATIIVELDPRESALERLTSLLRSLRALAVQHPGYEGGMLWFSEEQSKLLVIMSHWRTREAWESFKGVPGTAEVLLNMAPLLSRPLRERHFIIANDWDLPHDV